MRDLSPLPSDLGIWQHPLTLLGGDDEHFETVVLRTALALLRDGARWKRVDRARVPGQGSVLPDEVEYGLEMALLDAEAQVALADNLGVRRPTVKLLRDG